MPRFDSENTPPAAKLAKVQGGIQGASRRRRARLAGGPHHPRYAVEHANKHKNATRRQPAQTNLDVSRSSPDVAMADTTFADSMSSVPLPRYLLRPVFRKIAKETITAFAPELADTPLHYIRGGLQYLGPDMLSVVAGVKANPASNVLPKVLTVTVNDISSDMPTHMLALYSPHVPVGTKRRVTLFPIHNIIFATHCANIPSLPKSKVSRPDVPGSTISIPVVPLCIPAPEVFSYLSTFLYTKRIDHLLVSLLSCPVPPPLYRDDPTSRSVLSLLYHFASRLAAIYSTQTLLANTIAVNGLWRNACALGIDDAKLWCALDVAWEVLIIALSILTENRV